MKARSSREEPNIASIRSKSNYFQYSKKGLCQRWVQYGTTIFFLSNGFIHFEFSQSGLTTLMHVSIWRKSFVLQQLLGKYNQARKSTKFDPTVKLGQPGKGVDFLTSPLHSFIHLGISSRIFTWKYVSIRPLTYNNISFALQNCKYFLESLHWVFVPEHLSFLYLGFQALEFCYQDKKWHHANLLYKCNFTEGWTLHKNLGSYFGAKCGS